MLALRSAEQTHCFARFSVWMLLYRSFSWDSISFSTSELFQLCVCQHSLISREKKVQSNNHIPPLVLSLSLSHFLEGPIHRPGTILPYPERLQTLQLLNGWEQASLSFLWVTQLAMERPGPASFLFRLCLMASQCHDFTHTHYQPIAMQNSIFSSNHAPSQTAG